MKKIGIISMRNIQMFKKLFIFVNITLLALCLVPTQTEAAAASFYLAPSSATRQIGSNFSIAIGVNSGGNAVNAFEATVNLPTNILGITGVGTGGSLCSLWIQQPAISGSSVSFKCGIPSGTTASGTLVTISVRGNAVGTGNATISGARILAGAGQNVTGGASGGTYTITPPPPAPTGAPTVSSGTHPDQNAWYKNNSPAFTWTRGGGTNGFSYVFDQNSGTIPGQSVNTNGTSANFSGKADGVWYFHIRASGGNGWSNTTHFRVQIDSTAPTNLVVVTDPKVEADRRPMIAFNAVDATSGIAYYEIQMDKRPFQKAASPYLPSTISSGDHTFTVRVFDKAGNMTEASAKIKIKDIPIPKITEPKNYQTFKLAQHLEIKGTASSGTVIDIYFDGVSIARGVKVGADGKWKFSYESFIMPGKHQIFAVAVKDGIESKPSDKINIRIDPSAISIFGIIVPSWIVFLILIVIIIVLTMLVLWLFIFGKRKYDKAKKKFKERNKKTREVVEVDFQDMEKKIRKDVQTIFDEGKQSSKAEHNLEDKLEEDVEATEKDVEKNIEEEIKDL